MSSLDDALLLPLQAVTGADAADDVIDGRRYSAWERRMQWDRLSRVDLLVGSSWPTISPAHFLLFKSLAWAWSMSILVMTLSGCRPVLKFFVFLTNWNQCNLCLYLTCSLYISVRHWRGRKGSRATDEEEAQVQSTHGGDSAGSGSGSSISSYHPSPWFLRWTYLLAEHAVAWTTLVVLVYWSTEFPHWLSKASHSRFELFENVCVHAVTLVVIGSDLALGRVEFVFSHAAYTVCMSFLYLLCNGVYVAIAGGFLYEILKWDSFVTALAALGTLCYLLAVYPLGHWMVQQRNRWSGNQPPPTTTKQGTWLTCG